MEPRSLERGNDAKLLGCMDSFAAASMEPRSLERGNVAGEARLYAQRVASMEPRSLERGNQGAVCC